MEKTTEKKAFDVRTIVATDPPDPKTEALCLFSLDRPDLLQAQPQRPFLPSGLILWDVPDSVKVMAMIGTSPQLVVTYEYIPARWFSHYRSFAEILRSRADGFETAGWGTWDAVSPGVLMRLMFSEPVPNVQALMWGHTVRF